MFSKLAVRQSIQVTQATREPETERASKSHRSPLTQRCHLRRYSALTGRRALWRRCCASPGPNVISGLHQGDGVTASRHAAHPSPALGPTGSACLPAGPQPSGGGPRDPRPAEAAPGAYSSAARGDSGLNSHGWVLCGDGAGRVTSRIARYVSSRTCADLCSPPIAVNSSDPWIVLMARSSFSRRDSPSSDAASVASVEFPAVARKYADDSSLRHRAVVPWADQRGRPGTPTGASAGQDEQARRRQRRKAVGTRERRPS